MITLISERGLTKICEDDVDVIKAMAHPVRLQIVDELMHHKITQLMEILRLPQSTVSQHLSKLRRTLLRSERRGV